jgi:hypothetical protein
MEDQNAPATRQDLGAATQRLDEKIEQLRSEMNHGNRDLQERIDAGVARMLTAFYAVAETHGKRLMDVETTDSTLRSRLSTVENRLLDIEKRLNLPAA